MLAHVSYTMADPWSVSYTTPCTLSARFASLSFHTFSSGTSTGTSGTGSMHSPSAGRLQMRCAMAAEKGRPARAPHRYVNAVTIQSSPSLDAPNTPRTARGTPHESFGLYADGEYYGPFAFAMVSPCVVPGSSEPLTMPVRTFFPLEAD